MIASKHLLIDRINDAMAYISSTRQLSSSRNAYDELAEAIKMINVLNITYLGEWVEPVKQPIDLLSDDELLAEIKKRMNRFIGPARA